MDFCKFWIYHRQLSQLLCVKIWCKSIKPFVFYQPIFEHHALYIVKSTNFPRAAYLLPIIFRFSSVTQEECFWFHEWTWNLTLVRLGVHCEPCLHMPAHSEQIKPICKIYIQFLCEIFFPLSTEPTPSMSPTKKSLVFFKFHTNKIKNPPSDPQKGKISKFQRNQF